MEQKDKQLKLEELTKQERQAIFESYLKDKYQLEEQELKQEKIEQLEQQFQKEQNRLRQFKQDKPQKPVPNTPKNQYNFDIDEDGLDLFNQLDKQIQQEEDNKDKQLKLEELTKQERQTTFKIYTEEKYSDKLANLNEQQKQLFRNQQIEKLEEQFEIDKTKTEMIQAAGSWGEKYNYLLDNAHLLEKEEIDRLLDEHDRETQKLVGLIEQRTKQIQKSVDEHKKFYDDHAQWLEEKRLERERQNTFDDLQQQKLDDQRRQQQEKLERDLIQERQGWQQQPNKVSEQKSSPQPKKPIEDERLAKLANLIVHFRDRDEGKVSEGRDYRIENRDGNITIFAQDGRGEIFSASGDSYSNQFSAKDYENFGKIDQFVRDSRSNGQPEEEEKSKSPQPKKPIADERLAKLANLIVHFRDREEGKVSEGRNYRIENRDGNITIFAQDGRGEIFSASGDSYSNQFSAKDYENFGKIDQFVRDSRSNGQPEEEEESKSPPQHLRIEESLDDFKHWYYVQRASDDYQMQRGLKTPEDITPSGVNFHQRYLSGGRKNEASHAARDILTKQGLTTEREHHERLRDRIFLQFEENAQKITQRRYNAWKSQKQAGKVEITLAELKKWQKEAQDLDRSKEHLSEIDKLTAEAEKQGKRPDDKVKIDFKDYSNRLDDLAKTNKNNIIKKVSLEYKEKYKNTKTAASYQELKEWRKQAEKLGRSQKHLSKIDDVINNALKTQKGKSVEIGLRDKRAMERDKAEFFLQRLNPNKSQTASRGRSR